MFTIPLGFFGQQLSVPDSDFRITYENLTFDTSSDDLLATGNGTPTYTRIHDGIRRYVGFYGDDGEMNATDRNYTEILNTTGWLSNMTNYTFSGWYRFDVLPEVTTFDGYHALFSTSGYPTDHNSMILYLTSNGKFEMLHKTASGLYTWRTNDVIFEDTVDINSWYHIVLTVSSTGSVKFYMNGVEYTLTDPSSSFSLASNQNLILGTGYNLDEIDFDQKIDDFRVFSKVLSQNEVDALYNETLKTLNVSDYIIRISYDYNTFEGGSEDTNTPNTILTGYNIIAYDGDTSRSSVGDYTGSNITTMSNVTEFDSLPITYSFWAYITDDGGNAYNLLVGHESYGGSSGYRFYLYKNGTDDYGLSYWYGNGVDGSPQYVGTTVSQSYENKWTHFVISVTSNNIKTFLNGVLVLENDLGSNNIHLPSGSDVSIFGSNTTTLYNTDSYVDDFRVYNRELAVEEAFEIYNSTRYIHLSNDLTASINVISPRGTYNLRSDISQSHNLYVQGTWGRTSLSVDRDCTRFLTSFTQACRLNIVASESSGLDAYNNGIASHIISLGGNNTTYALLTPDGYLLAFNYATDTLTLIDAFDPITNTVGSTSNVTIGTISGSNYHPTRIGVFSKRDEVNNISYFYIFDHGTDKLKRVTLTTDINNKPTTIETNSLQESGTLNSLMGDLDLTRDGKTMILIVSNLSAINILPLTTAYDITEITTTYYTNNVIRTIDLSTMLSNQRIWSIALQEGPVNGDIIYIVSDNDTGYQKNVYLSAIKLADYEAATATVYTNMYVEYSLSEPDDKFKSINFSTDGLKMVSAYNDGGGATQYNLVSAFNVNTIDTSTYVFLNAGTYLNTTRGSTFNNNGTKLFLGGSLNSGEIRIVTYDLSTAYDISTASYNGFFASTTDTGNSNQLFDISYGYDNIQYKEYIYVCMEGETSKPYQLEIDNSDATTYTLIGQCIDLGAESVNYITDSDFTYTSTGNSVIQMRDDGYALIIYQPFNSGAFHYISEIVLPTRYNVTSIISGSINATNIRLYSSIQNIDGMYITEDNTKAYLVSSTSTTISNIYSFDLTADFPAPDYIINVNSEVEESFTKTNGTSTFDLSHNGTFEKIDGPNSQLMWVMRMTQYGYWKISNDVAGENILSASHIIKPYDDGSFTGSSYALPNNIITFGGNSHYWRADLTEDFKIGLYYTTTEANSGNVGTLKAKGTNRFRLNNWNHIVITTNSTFDTWKVYLNGVKEIEYNETTIVTTRNTVDEIWFSMDKTGSDSRYYLGRAETWLTTLTDTEVYNHFSYHFGSNSLSTDTYIIGHDFVSMRNQSDISTNTGASFAVNSTGTKLLIRGSQIIYQYALPFPWVARTMVLQNSLTESVNTYTQTKYPMTVANNKLFLCYYIWEDTNQSKIAIYDFVDGDYELTNMTLDNNPSTLISPGTTGGRILKIQSIKFNSNGTKVFILTRQSSSSFYNGNSLHEISLTSAYDLSVLNGLDISTSSDNVLEIKTQFGGGNDEPNEFHIEGKLLYIFFHTLNKLSVIQLNLSESLSNVTINNLIQDRYSLPNMSGKTTTSIAFESPFEYGKNILTLSVTGQYTGDGDIEQYKYINKLSGNSSTNGTSTYTAGNDDYPDNTMTGYSDLTNGDRVYISGTGTDSPGLLFDNGDYTNWANGFYNSSGVHNYSIGYRTNGFKLVNRILLYRTTGTTELQPGDITIQYWNGSSMQNVSRPDQTGFNTLVYPSVEHAIDLAFENVTAQYWKITLTKHPLNTNTFTGLSEILFYYGTPLIPSSPATAGTYVFKVRGVTDNNENAISEIIIRDGYGRILNNWSYQKITNYTSYNTAGDGTDSNTQSYLTNNSTTDEYVWSSNSVGDDLFQIVVGSTLETEVYSIELQADSNKMAGFWCVKDGSYVAEQDGGTASSIYTMNFDNFTQTSIPTSSVIKFKVTQTCALSTYHLVPTEVQFLDSSNQDIDFSGNVTFVSQITTNHTNPGETLAFPYNDDTGGPPTYDRLLVRTTHATVPFLFMTCTLNGDVSNISKIRIWYQEPRFVPGMEILDENDAVLGSHSAGTNSTTPMPTYADVSVSL